MGDDTTTLNFDDRDEFNRKVIAEKIITLLSSKIEVSPLVIDGGWGTGKTEFCHKLINLMAQSETHHLLYVDAFQADHPNEPLLTVLAEVLKVLPEAERSSFTQKAIPALRYGLKAIARAGVGHVLRQDATDVVEDFDKEIQKAADMAINSSVESMLKDHVKASESLKSLQEALQEIAAKKPIVLFIDELDRCRPDFAVNMLEIIKHTFDVEGVQFVLITNTQQLKASINHCYGHTVDAQRYLDKFLKYTSKLPSKSNLRPPHASHVSVTHYLNLIQQSPVLSPTKVDQDAAFGFVSDVIITRSLSLREVETLIRHLEIYQILTEEKALAEEVIVGCRLLQLMGVILFCFSEELSNEIYKGWADAKKLANFLGESGIVPIYQNELRTNHLQVVLTMLGQECVLNSNLFTPQPGHHEAEWEKLIDMYFKGAHHSVGKGERSRIVVNTIEVFRLGNN